MILVGSPCFAIFLHSTSSHRVRGAPSGCRSKMHVEPLACFCQHLHASHAPYLPSSTPLFHPVHAFLPRFSFLYSLRLTCFLQHSLGVGFTKHFQTSNLHPLSQLLVDVRRRLWTWCCVAGTSKWDEIILCSSSEQPGRSAAPGSPVTIWISWYRNICWPEHCMIPVLHFMMRSNDMQMRLLDASIEHSLES